eukprot:TRINITY_DN3424_c0_g3_i1.p1 TRINITY_DN3424_c0_g3~~TRINITY_DN3424_c0_g3_i1.p1  ORF type:complete len:1222 (+),score=530.56 TRINITY_DN3424_c0_g3_i1:133-3798(+)
MGTTAEAMDSLHLYNLTLEKGGAVSCSCSGSFSAPKQHEVVCGKGQWIELVSVTSAGVATTLSVQNIFGLVKRVAAFRLPGQSRDYLIVTSDSGRIVILEYNAKRSEWVKIHQETYGKTGLRRAVPAEYLATDPKGRAILIGAIEKQKFVYCLRRDEANITISSPLVAHKSQTIMYNVIGLDVGYENPVFAALEVDHSLLDEDASIETAEKHLIFYEYDLGLNHVVRKDPWMDAPLPSTANLLFEVPGGDGGPGGVLVCCDNFLYYMNVNHETLREVLPRRQDMGHPSNGLMIVSGGLVRNVPKKGDFFYLLQSECGDLYKVKLNLTPEKDLVRQVVVKYFDTIPVASNIMITRNGFLFAAHEFSNHGIYKFTSLGEDAKDVVIGAMTVPLPNGDKDIFPLFNPCRLRNLDLTGEIKSLCPLLDVKVGDGFGGVEGKRFYALCGRGPHSSLRLLQHGLSLAELGSQPFQGTPQKVWTLKRIYASQTHDYIVVSFINATMVFAIGETIQEVHDTQLLNATPTICCKTMQDDSLIQVHQGGIRHIRKDRRISDWKTSGVKPIVRADVNERQIVIALATGELIYFELDSHGSVNEVCKKELNKEVACLSIGPIPNTSIRSRFLAVGGTDKIVMVLSLDVSDNMATLARQACGSEPADIVIADLETPLKEQTGGDTPLSMFIGCQNGIVVRSTMDPISGEIADARPRFCGTLPCRLVVTAAGGRNAVMVLSSRTWLAYYQQERYSMAPLSTPPFTHAASMSVDACPEALVSLTNKDLTVYALEDVGGTFNQQAFDLKATPRGMARHPFLPHLIIVEADHRSYTDEEKLMVKAQYKAQLVQSLGEEAANIEDLPEKEYGAVKGPKGKWSSYLRVVDMEKCATHDLIELEKNHAAMCCSTVVFHDTGGEVHLVVGAVKDYVPNPKSYSSGLLLTFKFIQQGKQLELVHQTIVDGIPKALHPFQGRLLVAVNNVVKIYDLGRTKLLNKCENRQIPNMVVSLTSVGNRIFAGDITDSVHVMKYKREENKLSVFADDVVPRWTTCIAALDASTIAIGDKLGNVTVCRLDENVADDLDNNASINDGSNKWLYDRGFLNGAPQRLQVVASFFVGSYITSIQKACLTTGGVEVILYTTLNGTIGCLSPINKKRDAERLKLLEAHMRQEAPPLCGRDHLAFRSYYVPQRNVVDGDLLELLGVLPHDLQDDIAAQFDQTPAELIRKLEDLRNKVL